MRLLVTGASGFVGSRLAALAASRLGPERVTAAVGPAGDPREAERTEGLRRLGVRVVPHDLRLPDPLPDPVPDFDVLFHLAAYVRTEVRSPDVAVNDEGTRRLLDRLGDRLRGTRIVYASTLAAAEPAPRRLGGPGIPIGPATVPAPRTAYGRTKLRAEGIVRERAVAAGAHATILRLCTVYGPGYRRGGMFDVLPALLARGSLLARIAWPGRLSLVHVEDLARLLLLVAGDDRARGQTFLVSSGEDPTMGEVAAETARALGLPFEPLPLAAPLARLGRLASSSRLWALAPHRASVAAWRASLMLAGLSCDGSDVTRLLGMTYVPWREGLAGMYAEARAARDVEARGTRT